MNRKKNSKLLSLLAPKHQNYIGQVVSNRIKRAFFPSIDHKYLFILSPPFCGSTLLNEILSSSSSVSVNNSYGTREGQKLPSVRKIMFDHDRRWDRSLEYNWKYIRREWRKYWDLTRPVLLEKSPPNIIRAHSIQQAFRPSYFIIFHRNPYAHCESLIRRKAIDAEAAAHFAIRCLKHQQENIAQLTHTLTISYEFLTEKTKDFLHQINQFIPELSAVDTNKEFRAHNFHKKPMAITNLNRENIGRLTAPQLDSINKIFEQERGLLEYFGYKVMD